MIAQIDGSADVAQRQIIILLRADRVRRTIATHGLQIDDPFRPLGGPNGDAVQGTSLSRTLEKLTFILGSKARGVRGSMSALWGPVSVEGSGGTTSLGFGGAANSIPTRANRTAHGCRRRWRGLLSFCFPGKNRRQSSLIEQSTVECVPRLQHQHICSCESAKQA